MPGRRDIDASSAAVRDATMKYADTVLERLAPWCTGGKYLNFMSSEDVSAEKTQTAYSGVDYGRLQAIKAEHDPANMFRLNHNIPPRT